MQVLTIKKLREMLDKHDQLSPDDVIAFGTEGIIFGDAVKKTYPNVNMLDVEKILAESNNLQEILREAQQIDTLRMYQKEFV